MESLANSRNCKIKITKKYMASLLQQVIFKSFISHTPKSESSNNMPNHTLTYKITAFPCYTLQKQMEIYLVIL